MCSQKVISRIFGGLGNQLFCYAAARRLALANNAELVIDDISGFINDHIYQRYYQLDHFNIPCRKATRKERMEPFSRLRRYAKRAINQLWPFEARSYIQQKGFDFDPRLLHVKPHGTVYLEGYWQSEGYFKDIEVILRQDLQIRPPTDAVNHAVAEQINNSTAVAMHVRFFDQPNVPGNNNVSSDYYKQAVETMNCIVPEAHYFVFSDHPESARSHIPLPDSRITLVSHNRGDNNAYADLWLMTKCQHFIIANSTFSWWGAWLASHPGKQVIAPGFDIKAGQGVTAWGFKGLLPEQWILV